MIREGSAVLQPCTNSNFDQHLCSLVSSVNIGSITIWVGNADQGCFRLYSREFAAVVEMAMAVAAEISVDAALDVT